MDAMLHRGRRVSKGPELYREQRATQSADPRVAYCVSYHGGDGNDLTLTVQ